MGMFLARAWLKKEKTMSFKESASWFLEIRRRLAKTFSSQASSYCFLFFNISHCCSSNSKLGAQLLLCRFWFCFTCSDKNNLVL